MINLIRFVPKLNSRSLNAYQHELTRVDYMMSSEAIQVRERGEKMDGCRQDALNLRKPSLAFQVPSQTL